MLALLSRFMGTEMAQNGWWHADEWHRLQWANAEDDIGTRKLMQARQLYCNVLQCCVSACWTNTT